MIPHSPSALLSCPTLTAILVVAQAWGAPFEWWIHSMIARAQGVSEDAIEAIGHGRRPELPDDEQRSAYEVARELVHERQLREETLARAKEALGERAVVEVVMQVGFYQLISGLLESFQPPPPSGDLEVTGADLGILLGAFGTASEVADVDGSGVVDGADLGLLLGSWGACPTGPEVPECGSPLHCEFLYPDLP